MITIIGTCKIDSQERRNHLLHNLQSMRPLGDVFRWRLNIVGEFKVWAALQVMNLYTDVIITHDDNGYTYDLMESQMEQTRTYDDLFFWQEDHWFLCPLPELFWHAVTIFRATQADVLTLTHLTTSWTCKLDLPRAYDSNLVVAVRVDIDTQEAVWAEHPNAYVTGTPAIYSWEMAKAIMTFREATLKTTQKPDFELSSKHGRAFLESGFDFIEVIPMMHLFREVFLDNRGMRSVSYQQALEWLDLRDGEFGFGGSPEQYNFDRRDEAK